MLAREIQMSATPEIQREQKREAAGNPHHRIFRQLVTPREVEDFQIRKREWDLHTISSKRDKGTALYVFDCSICDGNFWQAKRVQPPMLLLIYIESMQVRQRLQRRQQIGTSKPKFPTDLHTLARSENSYTGINIKKVFHRTVVYVQTLWKRVKSPYAGRRESRIETWDVQFYKWSAVLCYCFHSRKCDLSTSCKDMGNSSIATNGQPFKTEGRNNANLSEQAY